MLGALAGRGPLVPLLALVVTASLTFVLALRLARQADAIARTTRLGGLWIGSVLLAAATSLPEILTDVNAALLDAPDIGVGDLLGSTMANMLTLAVLDLLFARRRILHAVASDHARLAATGILMTAMAGSAVATGGWGRIGHVGIETVAIAAFYLAAMQRLYRSLPEDPVPASPPTEAPEAPGSVLGGFLLASAGLAIVSLLLVLSAEAVSIESGLTETFVGTLLVGLTTSFPEIATTASAVRLGALDLAVGNILGSCMFNMTVLLPMDLVYVRGRILSAVSRDHLVSVLVAVACLGLGVVAILSRGGRRETAPHAESLLIVAAYAFGAWALYRIGAAG